jgi:hypothetical protein
MTKAYFAPLALAGALAVAACASEEHRHYRGGGREGGGGFQGGFVVQPIALLLTDFDANHDHVITRAELEAGIPAAWKELDANGAGKASPFEFAAWAKKVMGSENPIPGRITFDKNLDGVITKEEFTATLADEFARLDTNHDDKLDRSELVHMYEPSGVGMQRDQQQQQDPGGYGGGRGGRGGGRRGGGYPGGGYLGGGS